MYIGNLAYDIICTKTNYNSFHRFTKQVITRMQIMVITLLGNKVKF